MTIDDRSKHFIVAAAILSILVAAIAITTLSAQTTLALEDNGAEQAELNQSRTNALPPQPVPLAQTPEPKQRAERATLADSATDGPRLHITTSGAAGTAATFRLPQQQPVWACSSAKPQRLDGGL